MATGVDDKNRQSNIKFAVINTKIPTKALSISLTLQDDILLFDSGHLKVNLEIKFQYRNDKRIKTFTYCKIK